MTNESILIVSPTWIGDAVMCMPAVQLFRAEYPETEITMLAKPLVLSLWKMHPAIDHFQTLEKTFPTLGKLKQRHFDRAYIIPNSFRSAFLPFMAGIPKRIGARGHWRKWILSEIPSFGTGHQQFEAMSILGVQGTPKAPTLEVTKKSFQTLERKLAHFPSIGKGLISLFQTLENERPFGARPVVTLLPGAARGPSKRWPTENFALLAKNLCSALNAVVLLGGGPDDVAVCNDMEAEGYDIFNLAGQTTLSEWAAMLQMSHCVVSNDSGGMHLATAVGTPVVAIFGTTDPKKTGPLGKNIVLQKSEKQNREIKRDSEEAVRALRAVRVDEVFGAVKKLLPC